MSLKLFLDVLKKKRIEISFLSSASEVKIVFESINSLFFKCTAPKIEWCRLEVSML